MNIIEREIVHLKRGKRTHSNGGRREKMKIEKINRVQGVYKCVHNT